MYQSGIFQDSSCEISPNDHEVTAVGYGTDPTDGRYYILKNSWGTSWGEQGYMRMKAIDGAGYCGVTNEPYNAWPKAT